MEVSSAPVALLPLCPASGRRLDWTIVHRSASRLQLSRVRRAPGCAKQAPPRDELEDDSMNVVIGGASGIRAAVVEALAGETLVADLKGGDVDCDVTDYASLGAVATRARAGDARRPRHHRRGVPHGRRPHDLRRRPDGHGPRPRRLRRPGHAGHRRRVHRLDGRPHGRVAGRDRARSTTPTAPLETLAALADNRPELATTSWPSPRA